MKIERIDKKGEEKGFDITIRLQDKEYTKRYIEEHIKEAGEQQNSQVVEEMLKELANIIKLS